MSESNQEIEGKEPNISELLKSADRYVLAGEFDKASEQVNKVLEIEPDNIYGKAYLNRIDVFKQREGRKTTAKEEDEAPVESQDIKEDQETNEEDDRLKEHHETVQQEEAPVEQSIPESKDEIENFDLPENKDQSPQSRIKRTHASSRKLTPEQERRIVEEILNQESEAISNKPITSEIPEEQPHPPEMSEEEREKNEKRYQHSLEVAWSSGQVSEEVSEELKKIRISLGVSEQRHNELERTIKLTSYVNAVKKAWEDGAISPTSIAVLDDLRNRFGIPIEEHLDIEEKIMSELHGVTSKGRILIVDDDIELVRIIKTILHEEGYTPYSAYTPEEVLEILERTKPELILLDIAFPKPSMSGFALYEKIRNIPDYLLIPIVFMSGLDEEHIVQVGKKLGADDYIIKPCPEQMLISTIEGKIKRYRELKEKMGAVSLE